MVNTDPSGNDCVLQTAHADFSETVYVTTGSCDNVKVGDGQSKTYVAGTVTSIQAGADGHSVDIGYTPYGDAGGGGVLNASAAPRAEFPGLAIGYGNNAQGYQHLGITGATIGSPQGVAGFYAASLAGAIVGFEAGAVGAFDAVSLYASVEDILTKASSAVGNQGIQTASRDIAEAAGRKWVGEGAKPIYTGRGQGGVPAGLQSADGTKIYRTTNIGRGYINLVNKVTGGNLHVGW